ncbi:MAG: NusG domain II-containing protein [Lachnospiraceae bacterium]|nr:NusG domain II-containing protein [Lachnospiraceae bacterium]
MKKGDIILICVILCLGLAGFFLVRSMNHEDGGTLTVTVDGQVYETYDLDEDQEVSLDVDGWHNHFQIKDGVVSMTEADCPDQYCVKHSAITKVNETIICLPHKVVLEITGGSQERDIDG